MPIKNNTQLGVDYEYDTGHLLNDWRQSVPAGAYLFSGGPNDSPGWRTYQDNHFEAEGRVPIMVQAKLREQFPALREAWEQYLVLLHLYHDK